ncbi:MAG: cell division protein FtsQ/DivIB [Thomasclavelia sp.]
MKKKQQKVIYNYYDQEQVKSYLKKKKAKRRKRKRILVMIVIVIILIIAFFISDYSRLQSIKVIGNEKVTTEEIIAASNIELHRDFTFFTDLSEAEKAIEKTSLIKDATVTKDLFGKVTIRVDECEPIGQANINGILYVVSQTGRVIKNESGSLAGFVQRCPLISNFDEAHFKALAKQFAKLPTQVINQVSEVKYAPEGVVETRVELLMDDGKVLYALYDDMAKQLADNNYSAIMEKFPDQKYYDLCGKYVYAYN